MFISSSGNVGIGTTSPNAKLDVNGNILTNSVLYAGSVSSTRITVDGGSIQGYYSSEANARFLIGRDIYTSGQSGIALGGNGSFVMIGDASSTSGTAMAFAVGAGSGGGSSAEKMRINSSGNVGIGTTSPNAKLDVNGNTIISGSLTVITGSGVEFQVTNTGVNIGNAITDTHNVTGSVNASGSLTAIGSITAPTINFTSTLSSNGGEIRIVQTQFRAGNNIPFVWSQTTDSNGTKDLGIRRNTTGSLEIYDGVTADGAVANRRDLILRNITGSNALFSGSLNVTGSINVLGSITGSLFGTASWANNATTASYVLQAVSASFASTASFVQNAQTASYVLQAVSASFASTASSADNFLVRGTLTAQTIVAQVITSSTDFVTGSTRFGTLLANTHQFTGSVSITGSLNVIGAGITGSLLGTASFASTSSNVLGGAANYIPLWNSATTLNSSVMYQSSSNIGIGIFPQTGFKLDVNGQVVLRGDVYSNGNIIGFGSNTNYKIAETGNSWLAGTTGNVGIGTTSPNAKLEVSGSTIISGSLTVITSSIGSSAINVIANGTSGQEATINLISGFSGVNGDSYIKATVAELRLFASSVGGTNSRFTIYTGGSERIRVDSTGNVGIGTTSPTSKLHVIADTSTLAVSSQPGIAAQFIYPVDGRSIIRVENNNTNAAAGATGAAYSLIAFSDSSSNPAANRHEAQILLGAKTSGQDGALRIIAPRDLNFYTNAQNVIMTGSAFLNYGTFAATINSSGSMGIGTTSPYSKLDVIGTIAINGAAFATNSATYTQIYKAQSNSIGMYLGGSGDPANYYDNTTHYFRSSGGGSTYVTINSAGVGIGTTSPSYKLDVFGSPRFYGDGNHMYTRIFSGASNKDSKILIGNDAERFNIGLTASSNVFSINSSNGGTPTSINIDYTSGNVGIGTTTPTLATLQVNGNVYATSFTGSFSGSITNAVSASYAATASYATNFTIGSSLIIDQTLTDYASVAASSVGSNNLFSQNTGSYTSAFFKYTCASGSSARAGEVVAVWNGTTAQFYDNSTVDVGNTTAVTSSAVIVTGQIQFNMQTNSSGWAIKSIATFM